MKIDVRVKYCIIGLFLGVLCTGVVFYLYRCNSSITQAFFEAKLMSQNVRAGLAFDDSQTITRLLATFEVDKSVIFGGVYDTQNNLFASYYRKGMSPEYAGLQQSAKIDYSFRTGYVKVSEPVLLDGERLGTVCIYYEL
jgi:hypothetical protein